MASFLLPVSDHENLLIALTDIYRAGLGMAVYITPSFGEGRERMYSAVTLSLGERRVGIVFVNLACFSRIESESN